MDDPQPLPESSRLPEDAERMGLTPLTAPGLQVASALHNPSPQAQKFLLWALGGLVALIIIVVVVAALS